MLNTGTGMLNQSINTNLYSAPSRYLLTHIHAYTHACIHLSLQEDLSYVFVWGVLSGSFCLEGFVWGAFCQLPRMSEYICYIRKLNITINFRFHIYDTIFLKCDVTSLLTLLPLSHLLGPLHFERDVPYGRPFTG